MRKKFGFVSVEGAEHDAISLFSGGKKVATTRFSRGRKGRDISDVILSRIAIQVRVPPSFLRGMVTCTVSKAQYLQYLQDAGHLE